jgi:hypothetical protein
MSTRAAPSLFDFMAALFSGGRRVSSRRRFDRPRGVVRGHHQWERPRAPAPQGWRRGIALSLSYRRGRLHGRRCSAVTPATRDRHRPGHRHGEPTYMHPSTPPPFWNKPALSDVDSKRRTVDLKKRVDGWAPPIIPVRSSAKTSILVMNQSRRQHRMRPAARQPEGTCFLRSQLGSFYFG